MGGGSAFPSLGGLVEVLQEAKRGYARSEKSTHPVMGGKVPIYRTMPVPPTCGGVVPVDIPLEIYLRLQDGPYGFLLEGVQEAVNRQRYVVMGGTPALVRTYENEDPLVPLERDLANWTIMEYPALASRAYGEEDIFADVRDIPLRTLGAMGYVGYDAVRFFEPRVNSVAEMQVNKLNIPDSCWMFYDTLVAYDFLRNCIHLIALVDVVDEALLEDSYAGAVSRMDTIENRLRTISHVSLAQDYDESTEAVSNVGEAGYKGMVSQLKEKIAAGDVIQTVPSQRLDRKTSAHPFHVYRKLRALNPSPYMFYIDLNDFQIVGASPERLLKVESGTRKLTTHPIAGTRPRGKTSMEDLALEKELLCDPKEISEHIMLVDLGRNDVNRVCQAASVKVDSLMGIERYSHVMHIVSQVSGTLRQGVSAFDAFRSVFPAGTVSGAPKVRAMELVAELEQERRGVYAGAVGYCGYDGHVDVCIALRTLIYKQGHAYLQAGGGIVHDSDQQAEYMETIHKMGALAKAVDLAEEEIRSGVAADQYRDVKSGGGHEEITYSVVSGRRLNQKISSSPAGPSTDFVYGGITSPEVPISKRRLGGKVLMIDNYDSFTWNLYQYLSLLGAEVVVFRNDKITVKQAEALNPSRIVISPGPCTPKQAGVSKAIISAFAGHIPILGVCLGEQCMVELFGGDVSRCSEIKHGKTSAMTHDEKGIFAGVPQNFHAIRYHSLVADPPSMPDVLEVSSRSELGHIMGIRHKKLAIEGVQFHPESVKTEHSLTMLRNFLEVEGGEARLSAKECIRQLSLGSTVTVPHIVNLIRDMVRGKINQSQISALLALLPIERLSYELVSEAAKVVTEHAPPCHIKTPVGVPLCDIVGTGGDGADAFNVSTASGMVVAACGAFVAKHGNRSSSGKCGSADFLEALGATIDLEASETSAIVEECGFGFLFAKKIHTCMKNVAAPRKSLGVRTIFNVIGPLVNPANIDYQVTGVASKALGDLFAKVFQARKVKRAIIVHSHDGLDEISPAAPTWVWDVRDGQVTHSTMKPEDFGMKRLPLDLVCGGSATDRAASFRRIVNGCPDGERDEAIENFVILNSAALLFVAGLCPNLAMGAKVAKESLKNGKAKAVLEKYVAATHTPVGTSAGAKRSKTILETIVERTVSDLEETKRLVSLDEVISRAKSAPSPICFHERLRCAGGTAVVAEIKRASPSQGNIAMDVDAAEQASVYARAGAAGISVLTEPHWFKGSLDDMITVRRAIAELGYPARPAILCKDFIVDEFQVYNARAHGADAILLIVAALPNVKTLAHLHQLAQSLSMCALVEVNSSSELETALGIGAKLIGVNNRNLHDFSVDLGNTARVFGSHKIPSDTLLMALSGIRSRADVDLYGNVDIGAVLVGQALMQAENPTSLIRELGGREHIPLVKICGIKSIAAAATAVSAGADFVGLVFAPSSRKVSVSDAKDIASVVRKQRQVVSSDVIGLSRHSGFENDTPRWFSSAAVRVEEAVRLRKPLLVGVFADQEQEYVERVAREVGLDIVQLSGNESDAYVAGVSRNFTVIRAVHVGTNDDPASVLLRLRPGHASAILLDTKDATMRGGTGKAFDWSVAADIQKRCPVFLAGGLNLDNIATAVGQVRPWAVDVSSGVETNRSKDLFKIRSFVELAKYSSSLSIGTAMSPVLAGCIGCPSTVQDENLHHFFGDFGGRYVPETLVAALEELEENYLEARRDPSFAAELEQLSSQFIGRPTPMLLAKRLTKACGGARIWLKREDLCHTGAHKINNAIGQGLLALRLGKKRIIAETGAGQHGVATATACAILGLECTVYMGGDDCRRQSLNVFRMENLGAKVVGVESGSRTLKDAINEAMRDWVTNVRTTHYIVGSAIGPHPFPTIVRDFQSVIGRETLQQMYTLTGKAPDAAVACVGGGSNAIGLFHPLINYPTKLFGVEAGGLGTGTNHSATLVAGSPGVLHGTRTFLLQDAHGQIQETHSISAGLDYPAVGPEHAYLLVSKRASYHMVTDEETLVGFNFLSTQEGIVPALETSHAISFAMKLAATMRPDQDIVIGVSGRGDKDFLSVAKAKGISLEQIMKA